MQGLLHNLKTVAVAAVALSLLAACASRESTRSPTASQAPQPTPTTAPAPTGERSITPGQPVKVALLLPTTGRAATAGQDLLNAAQLALFDVGDSSLQLIIKDTGDSQEGAAVAMQQAVNEGAQLVLGPLFSSQIDAVRPLAEANNINVISFSNDESKASGNIFVMGLSPREQARRIVAYAAGQGYSSIAVIAPNTPFGSASLAGAREGANSSGAVIVSTVFYNTDKVNLAEEVQQLDPSANAIFAPDTAKRLIGLAPLLAYRDFGGGNVKFLGSALWDDPLIGTEPNLIGAWFPAAAPASWQTFKERYNQAYGKEPLRIAGLGYDGVALAALLVRKAQQGNINKAQATPGQWPGLDRNTLTAGTGFSGIDGIFRFLPDGKVERGLAILEVQREHFPVVQEAPASFQMLIN